MDAMPATATTPKKTVSPRHALLEELIGIAVQHASDQYLDLATRLAGALIDATDGDSRLIQQRIRAGNLLRNRNYAFLHLASTALEQALRRDIADLAPTPQARMRAAEQVLSLVPYEEMDNKVALGGVSKPFDVRYADQLQTLNVRLGVLLDRDILRTSQNPFRPEVFLSAMQQAWAEFDPEPQSQALLPPLLKPELFIELGPMFDALSLALQRKGVAPGSLNSYKNRKADTHTAAPPRVRGKQAELAQQLRQFFASSDGAAGDGGEQGAGVWQQGPAQGFQAGLNQAGLNNEAAQRRSQLLAREPLLNYLAQLQKAAPYESIGSQASGAAPVQSAQVFYLPRIKESVPQGSLSRADESTIDLLSAIFDSVFQDQSISQEIRDLIRFLQIPVLKAALVDKNFFFQETHPARRLIDLMSRMGWEQRKGPDDPLFQAMQRSVDRVGRDVDHELSVFTQAVDELEASIQAEERATASAIAEPIAAALKQEKMAEAGKAARKAVALRIGTGEVVAVVEAFLEQRWVSVLTIAYSIEADKPGAVGNASRAMDDLIWSVKPKITPEERKQLISKLPGLLSTLNQWLDIIKWQDADRLQFFAELAECHASIVRAPLDLSAERQLEISLQVAQQAAERRLALQAKAAQAGQPCEASIGDMPEAIEETDDTDDTGETGMPAVKVGSLVRGMWLEFAPESALAGPRQLKLAWISPLRTLYIFATASRQEAFSMSGQELALRLRERRVQVIRSVGVVARALSQALTQQAANEAGTGAGIGFPAAAFG